MAFNAFIQNLSNTINKKIKEFNSSSSVPEQVSNPFMGKMDASIFNGLDKEGFLDKIAQGMKLDSSDSLFYENINEFGAETIFDYFDKNGDGTISEEEAKETAAEDKNTSDLSGYDLYYSTYQIAAKQMENALGNIPQISPPSPSSPSSPQGGISGSAPSSGASSAQSSQGSAQSAEAQETPEEKLNKIENEEIPALEAKKQKVTDTAQKDTDAKNKELDELLAENEKKLGKLGEDYSKKQDEIKDCDNKISECDKNISDAKSEKSSNESKLSNLKGELSTLQTNTKDENINKANSDRKTQIENEIKDIEIKVKEQEEKIKENEDTKKVQEGLKAQKEGELKELQEKIAKKNPEIAEKMSKIQEEIKTIETNKTTEVQAFDSEIEAKRAQAAELQKQIGEAKGAAQSGPYANYDEKKGQALANSALNVRNTVGWCLAGVNDSLQATDEFGQAFYFEGAYEAANALRGNDPNYADYSKNFQEVNVSREELAALPAGAIVVWDQSAGHQWGHISIALGDGRESSDHIAPQITERDANYSVFIPV